MGGRARGPGAGCLRDVDDILHGAKADQRVQEGPPAQMLVELARETGADEIVVGSRGFGSGRALLGSVSRALLHETDRPVVVVNRRAAERQIGVRPQGPPTCPQRWSHTTARPLRAPLSTTPSVGPMVA